MDLCGPSERVVVALEDFLTCTKLSARYAMAVVVTIVLLDLANRELPGLVELRHWNHWRLSLMPFASLPTAQIYEMRVILEPCSHHRSRRDRYRKLLSRLLLFILFFLLFRTRLITIYLLLFTARFVGFFSLVTFFILFDLVRLWV